MADDLKGQFERALVGRSCLVERREHDWTFDFGDGRGFAASVPWRLVSAMAILLTGADDGHKYGLPVPVDAEHEANRLLKGATVDRAKIDAATSDLAVWFTNGLRLDVFNNSTGYESWQGGAGRISVIALGGGGLAFH